MTTRFFLQINSRLLCHGVQDAFLNFSLQLHKFFLLILIVKNVSGICIKAANSEEFIGAGLYRYISDNWFLGFVL